MNLNIVRFSFTNCVIKKCKKLFSRHFLQYVEVPIPTPKKDEVLVKVEAVGINPIDYKIQHGMLRPFAPKKFPHIPCKFKYIGANITFSLFWL